MREQIAETLKSHLPKMSEAKRDALLADILYDIGGEELKGFDVAGARPVAETVEIYNLTIEVGVNGSAVSVRTEEFIEGVYE